jgi:hypothetical protein
MVKSRESVEETRQKQILMVIVKGPYKYKVGIKGEEGRRGGRVKVGVLGEIWSTM